MKLLQAATSSGKPILLRLDLQAGHGMGSTRQQRDEEFADIFAFALWQRTPTRPHAGNDPGRVGAR